MESLASWHPFVVHFAVALTITAAAFDVVDFLMRAERFESMTLVLTLVALPFLLLAVVSGNLASDAITDAARRAVISRHESYANIAVWLFTAASFWRVFLHVNKRFSGVRKIAYVFVMTAAAMSVFLAARKGGEIFHDPVRTEHRPDATGLRINPHAEVWHA